MTEHFVTYDDYSFDREVPLELEVLIEEFDHVLAKLDPFPDVKRTWTLEKPAGRLGIHYPDQKQAAIRGSPTRQDITNEDFPTTEDIGIFLTEFSRWFYFAYDGYRLYFSRFPTIPPYLAAAAGRKHDDPALAGILLGYTPADVAQWVLEQDGEFKTEPGYER